eukprot:TRINITY_DN16494_c0_g1_i2.p1 TRINITY_DN16494_c0_g1~~TRINITY_DN16494_c0_g1_i2.p1  ORF type:complete len:380 (+),score=85.90 TRINITY_DN16494_c0_g1_i2:93-1232(+)
MSAVSRRLVRLAQHNLAGQQSLRGASASRDGNQLPELYLGTMTFGWNQASSRVDDAVAQTMLNKFLSSGGLQVDTARIYSGGQTEDILGRILHRPEVASKPLVLGTKAHPSQPGGLSKAGIRTQLEASLKAMGLEKVDVLYLHQPDPEHDLSESLECVQELLQEGLISKYGMSNYSAVEVDRCCSLCKQKGWSTPHFYQGLYNPLNRLIEEQLLPILRRHGVAFIAYNPLAAGLLTGKHASTGDVIAGRFKDNPNYLPRFYTEPNFRAVADIRQVCDEAGLDMVTATYAWLLQHSQLDAALGDGLLLGASSMTQLEENIKACQTAVPLPGPVLAAFDGAWETVCSAGKSEVFPFWRSYSRDQPGRETMHPGASYDAAKK